MERRTRTRSEKPTTSGQSLSQPSRGTRINKETLSQPGPSRAHSPVARHSRDHSSSMASEKEIQLAGSVIRYILAMDKKNETISRARLMKNVFEGQKPQFHQAMNQAKNLLSKTFGYQLVEVDNTKYILVNEVENILPHIQVSKTESARQVLLLVVLTHIFMLEEPCTEDLLWDYLRNLAILRTDKDTHDYFGNVKQIITEEFVAKKYLDRVIIGNDDPPHFEFKWGIRAELEFSPQQALDFMCQIYNGRPASSWPVQFKAANAMS